MSLYKIGELARLTDTTTRTLRYYEELNLLEPSRTESGQRLYSEQVFDRLNLINQLKAGGFSLNDIKDLFDSWRNPETGHEAARETMTRMELKLKEISELQDRLERLKKEISGLVEYLHSCTGCSSKPSLDSCQSCDKHDQHVADPMLIRILKRS